MIVEDFNELETNTLAYGGKSGQKLGVIINGENWFLKFPKSTKGFRQQDKLNNRNSKRGWKSLIFISRNVYDLWR